MAIFAFNTRSPMRHARWCVLLLCLLGGVAQAIQPGSLVMHSPPGEPLRASIPLLLSEGLELASLRAKVADDEIYQQRELLRPPLLDGLRVALLARGEQRARIQLFSSTPWQGEALDLLLELESPEQTQLVHFKVPAITRAELAQYVQVEPNETLDNVAIRLAKQHSRSYLHMMYALYRANPEAFYRNNMNNLRDGVRLRIPSSEELYRFDDAEAFNAIREHQRRWQQASQPSAPTLGDAQALRADLQALSQEEALFDQQNQALREQLNRLESRMSHFATELLEPTFSPKTEATSNKDSPANDPTPSAETQPPLAGGPADIPAWLFLLLLVIAVASGLLLQYRQHAGEKP